MDEQNDFNTSRNLIGINLVFLEPKNQKWIDLVDESSYSSTSEGN
jgi:hypothetical protein